MAKLRSRINESQRFGGEQIIRSRLVRQAGFLGLGTANEFAHELQCLAQVAAAAFACRGQFFVGVQRSGSSGPMPRSRRFWPQSLFQALGNVGQ